MLILTAVMVEASLLFVMVRGNVFTSHTVCLDLISSDVSFLVEFFPRYFLNCNTNSGNLGHIPGYHWASLYINFNVIL